MNCLLETLASVYLTARARLMADPVEDEVYSAQDSLENCRRTMEGREFEFLEESRKLAGAALAARRAGNQVGARARVLERRRVVRRLEKLRNGMGLVDAQLEAIRSSELDREIMLTLKASSSAMKKAGIGAEAINVEQVMGELDDTIRETQEISNALAVPLVCDDDDQELDAELEWLEETPLLDPGMPFVSERPAASAVGAGRVPPSVVSLPVVEPGPAPPVDSHGHAPPVDSHGHAPDYDSVSQEEPEPV